MHVCLEFNEFSTPIAHLGKLGHQLPKAYFGKKELQTHVNLALKIMVWLQTVPGIQKT